jgi:APA family basic amino acid/polyamine antiporter
LSISILLLFFLILNPGVALFGSFLIAALAAFISALCFMECATRFPGVSGSAYSYAYFALGEVMGWLYV